jgi:hypothetical protein
MSLFISSFKKERLLLLVIFVAIISATIVIFGLPSDSKKRIVSKNFWINKTHTNRKYSLIVSGDSRIYRGISPSEMEKVLDGYRGFNVGYSSGGFSKLMYDKIEQNIDFNAEKPVIVLGVSPWSLTPRAGQNKHLSGELNRKREELIQAKYFSSVNTFFAPYTIKELYDKQTDKEEVKGVVYRYTSKGWVASNTDVPNPGKALGSERTAYVENQVSGELLSWLVEKVREWESKGVAVFAFRPPANHAMEALEDSLSGFREPHVVDELEKAGAVWFDFDIDEYFSYDGSHLDEQSAVKLSRKLALKIKQEMK